MYFLYYIIGYDQILKRIRNMRVIPPGEKTCIELAEWMKGYIECLNNVTEAILSMKDQYGR